MVESLSSPEYQSRKVNNAFLLHSTGNRPINGEVDASIIYGDYYYIEALLKYKKLLKHNEFLSLNLRMYLLISSIGVLVLHLFGLDSFTE
jgi:hypothetical protein